MPFAHTIDHGHGTMTTTASGNVTVAEIVQHLDDERLQGALPYSELIDARTASVSISATEVRTVVDVLRGLGAMHRLGPTAVVVATDVGYGMLRMLEMLVEDVCVIRPFRDVPEAQRWLQSPTAAV